MLRVHNITSFSEVLYLHAIQANFFKTCDVILNQVAATPIEIDIDEKTP